MNEHEEMFARSFVVPTKVERYLEQFKSENGRKKLILRLDHSRDLDTRNIETIPTNLQSANAIYEILVSKGAPEKCYVISSNSRLDGRRLNLKKALEETIGYGTGTFISCLPGKLGFYESSEINGRVILEKP